MTRMPLDPHLAAVLELVAASGYPPMHEGDADELAVGGDSAGGNYTTGALGVDPHDPRLSPLRASSLAGLIHGFLDMSAMSPASDTAVADAVRRFRGLLEAAQERTGVRV
jgi:hypothetical protein